MTSLLSFMVNSALVNRTRVRQLSFVSVHALWLVGPVAWILRKCKKEWYLSPNRELQYAGPSERNSYRGGGGGGGGAANETS